MDLKNELFRLEYALTEEQFHYDSIPERKAMTLSKIRLKSIVLFPVLIEFGIFSYFSFQAHKTYTEGPEKRLAFAFLLVLSFFLLIFLVFLLGSLLKELPLIFGIQKKSVLFNHANYRDEEIHTKDKIMFIQEEILRVKAEIKELKESRSYEEVVKDRVNQETIEKDPEEMTKEEFFCYALGTWGEDRESLLINYKHGSYEREKENLEKEIRCHKDSLYGLTMLRNHIDLQYQKAIDNLIYFIMGFFALIMFEYSFGHILAVTISILVVASILSIFLLYFCSHQYREAHMHYQVEHNYNKVKYYAEEHQLIPIKKQKNILLLKIADCEKRLHYVEQILSFDFS